MVFFDKLSHSLRIRFIQNYKDPVQITSFPKAGRTWLKVMLSEYLTTVFNLSQRKNLLIENFYLENPKTPKVKFIHDDTPFWKKKEELEHSKRHFKSSKVILIVRDPRDIIVSAFFQKSKRHKFKSKEQRIIQGKPIYTKSLKEYVYEEVGGIDTLIEYYNIWWSQKSQPMDFKILKYENLRQNTFEEMQSVLSFIGIDEVDVSLLSEVIENASFDKLRQLEKDQVYKLTQLIPSDPNDEESFKVRRGKVGGYVDYLAEEEIQYLTQKMRQNLNSTFEYS